MTVSPNRITEQGAIDALSLWLEQNHYSQHARESILRHAALEGTPTGSPYLDPADEAGATGAFIRAMSPVPYDHRLWSDEGIYLDIDSILDAAAVEPPDDWKGSSHAGWALIPPELEDDDLDLPPIAGGSPEAGAFVPTDEDWADYRRWSEGLDARRPGPGPTYGYE